MIRTRQVPSCFLCGSAGELLYEGLEDVLYGAEGTWSIRRCSNRGCGVLWLDPQPTEEDIGQAYARYFTHQGSSGRAGVLKRIYGEVRGGYLRSSLGYEGAGSRGWLAPIANLHPGAADVFASSVMFLRAPRNGTSSLLDVGSGGGDFMLRMRDLGWSVTGVETDPIAVERARTRGLDVHQGDLDDAELPESSFDAITMSHVIEHIHEPRSLLDRCRMLLKPAGTLVILTPNSASWGHRHFGRDWLGLDPPRHIHVFNPASLRQLLVSANLTPGRVATLAINASAVWPTSAAIHRSRSSSAGERPAISLRSTRSGIARQAAERLMRNMDPAAGEDLLAIATRSA